MKTILVTGASSGIGRALAVRAARAGYAVYAVGRNVKALAALGGQIGQEGGIVSTDVIDISDPANAPGLIGRMLGAFGRIDVVVNNAGTVAMGPIAAQSDEDLRAQFGTHVIGPLALVREALPSLRASSGQVIMLGSGVARVPVGGLGAYPPSKAALRSATTILRRELAPLEIAVTYVDPGAVDTAFMSRAGMPGAPQNVLVSPELVARKILIAITTRQRTLNVAPLQTAAVTIAELLPGLTEAILIRNPSIVGAGATFAGLETTQRSEKIALPNAAMLPAHPPAVATVDVPDETLVDEATNDTVPGSVAEPIVEPPPTAEGISAIEHGIHHDISAARESVTQTDVAIATTGEATAVEAAPAQALPVKGAPAEPLHAERDEEETAHATSGFDAALEPLSRRMEKAKLDKHFVRELLVPDAVIDVGEAAMKWAGMPNKHERALTSEVFFALAEWGYLAPRADGRYRVVFAADHRPVM